MPDQRVIDGRDLEPPEPLELTLAALDTLGPGEELLLLVNCEPHPLYAILKRNGFRYAAEWREDGCNECSANFQVIRLNAHPHRCIRFCRSNRLRRFRCRSAFS